MGRRYGGCVRRILSVNFDVVGNLVRRRSTLLASSLGNAFASYVWISDSLDKSALKSELPTARLLPIAHNSTSRKDLFQFLEILEILIH